MKFHLSGGRLALAITIFLNLVFIFTHASFPPSVSGAEIDAVGGAIEEIFSESTAFGAFLQRNVGNIAHFCEYGLLGGQIGIGIYLWGKRRFIDASVSALGASVVALLDETVQIFSGRHSSIADAWIDIFGFVFALTVTLSVLCAAGQIKKKRACGSDRKE